MVKGPVIDRIQKLRSGRAVLNNRICRASYALSLDLPYDSKKHKGQEVYKHYDGVVYARNHMDWMIRKVCHLRHIEALKCANQIKGEGINPGKPPERRAVVEFEADTPRRAGQAIYMSFNDPVNLPTYAAHGKSSSRA